MRLFAARSHRPQTRHTRAFTLVEVTLSLGILGLAVLAVYSGITAGISGIRMARENLRATQILIDKLEGIRLYTWSQLNTPGFVPTSFVEPYDPLATNLTSGIRYAGSVQIEPHPAATSYAADMRVVRVSVQWQTGGLQRSRQMSTYVSKSGIQNYLY
jgi:type II secretory pathway pseudopilin PulG